MKKMIDIITKFRICYQSSIGDLIKKGFDTEDMHQAHKNKSYIKTFYQRSEMDRFNVDGRLIIILSYRFTM
jgi:hypothetical protein